MRNWDYRFTWLRDATFTLYALIRLGFVEETQAFIDWLKGRLSDDAERGPLQVMYGTDGRQKLDEMTLDHLCGYEHSRPVRIGNAAYQQLQLDIYGEMMDSIYLANKYGNADFTCRMAGCSAHPGVAGKELAAARRGDMGGPRWGKRIPALSRHVLGGLRSCFAPGAEALAFGSASEWQDTRDAIREDIFTNFWDEELQSFVQSKGTKDLGRFGAC